MRTVVVGVASADDQNHLLRLSVPDPCDRLQFCDCFVDGCLENMLKAAAALTCPVD
jgi:hypothetical protein